MPSPSEPPPPSLIPPADSPDVARTGKGGVDLAPPSLRPSAPPFAAARAFLPPELDPDEWGSAPPSSRIAAISRSLSLPPLPAVQPILELAAQAREKKDWDAALEHYKKALFVAPAEEPSSASGVASTQASIYASIAEVKLAQGKPREAETNYEKTLTIDPKHRRSLDGLVAIATAAKDWERVAIARRRRAEAYDDPDDKVSELCVVSDIEESKLRRIDKALATLEIASVLRPDDIGILLKLRDLYTLLHAWPKLIDVLDELVSASTDHRHRGSFRFAQADVVLGRLREEPRGLAFLELALDEDPQCDRALSALVAVRARREEWIELSRVYESLIDRYAGIGDRDRAWEACRKLGTLRRDRLHDGPGALEALRGAVELRPDDAESRATIAELHAAKGDRAAAVRELETVATHTPLRAQTYRRLFELHHRAQRLDRAWLAATCLEELGASDVSQELVIEQFRPDGPIRPTTAVAEDWWEELLAAPGHDPIVSDILLTIGPTALALKLEELEANRRLPVLDPEQRQDKTSTASAVRTFVWAARALGIAAPDLYVWSGLPSGIAALAAKTPSTALGPQVLAGRTVQELAFLAGRHLTYYRAPHYPLVFFPTLAELSSLVLSAVRLVIPGISVPPPAEGARPGDAPESTAFGALGGRLPSEQKERLKEVVARLDARGGRLDLFAWIRGVELTATRVGLLLSGDLRTAMRMLKEETRMIGDLGIEAKRSDLLTFTASESYALLRERMGAAIRPRPSAPGLAS